MNRSPIGGQQTRRQGMKQRTSLLVLGLMLIAAGAAFGQGAQTGALTGNVTADNQGLPGVLVTATSDKAQGERTAATEANGDYIIRGLPPGSYTVVFSLEGMESVTKTIEIPLGGTARADAAMAVTVATETVIVTGESPAALETTTTGANFKSEDINSLPIVARTPTTIANLAGGLTDNGPVGNITISGGFAYDNVFLVNGVDVTDRYFGTSDGLFIEEAVDEVQVMTSGVSAEYGRFSGGVINAVTKSGGNKFEGTLRGDYSKPEWRDETPLQKDLGQKREGDLSKTYSATLGGRIIADKLWFFAADRDRKVNTQSTLAVSNVQITDNQKVNRYEGKLTWAVSDGHNLQASYLNNDRTDSALPQINPLEPQGVSGASLPNDGWVASYNGVFGANVFGEVRYS
jgi:outer membrane receptor for ferrienterochelin and colicin